MINTRLTIISFLNYAIVHRPRLLFRVYPIYTARLSPAPTYGGWFTVVAKHAGGASRSYIIVGERVVRTARCARFFGAVASGTNSTGGGVDTVSERRIGHAKAIAPVQLFVAA